MDLGNLEINVMSFAEMADLPNFEAKRRALMLRCEEVFQIAKQGRTYIDKKGIKHIQPDAGAMNKAIELSARLLGVLSEADKRVKDGDEDSRAADIEQVASLLRSVGYIVKKAA